jgi:hypothetical protein
LRGQPDDRCGGNENARWFWRGQKKVEQRVLTTWPAAADQPPPAAYPPSKHSQTRRSDERPSSPNFVSMLVASPTRQSAHARQLRWAEGIAFSLPTPPSGKPNVTTDKLRGTPRYFIWNLSPEDAVRLPPKLSAFAMLQ